MTIRVLFVHRLVGFLRGGTETHIKELSKRLAGRGHSVFVITRSGREARRLGPGVGVWQIPRAPGEREDSYYDIHDPRYHLYRTVFILQSLFLIIILKIRGLRFDVLSVHSATEALVGRAVRAILGIPYVFVLESYDEFEESRARHADLQITTSSKILERCEKHWGYSPMFIPIGVDLSRFTALGSKVPEFRNEVTRVVLSVSRLVAHKRLDVLVRAAHEISLRRGDYVFLIVGEGPERNRLQGLVDSYGMRDSVLLGGGVIEEELPAYYRTASVFVITEPAIDEFWITALESMGCGTPVIAPSSGGHLELIEGCGLVFTPGDAVSLAGRITEICEDERLRLALKDEMGKRIVKFDWNRAIRSYEEAYCRASLTKLAKANERADSHLTASMDAARRAMLRCRRPIQVLKAENL